ncbi:TIGR04282 family arsenosugar biosynthesis glycosyltransferase [Chloroflexota bacterium]
MYIETTSLVVFIRFPHTGKVKSRLARTLGPEKAARLYLLCAQQTVSELDKAADGVRKYLSISDKNDEDRIRDWTGSGFKLISQSEGDIGQRLENCFDDLLKESPGKVIITASDVPDLSAEMMNEAVSALDNNDIVIGPCNDGGYYLIGMKRPHAELFRGIPWSTESVLDETIAIASSLGLSVSRLASLRDIDTEDDLKEWVRASAGTSSPLMEYAESILNV